MPDATKPPDWMVRDVMARLDGVFPSAAEMREAAVLAHHEATIADLRDRLRIMARMVCEGCGCARAVFGHALCVDCEEAEWGVPRGAPVGDWGDRAAACISVGLRALCGRRILEGC